MKRRQRVLISSCKKVIKKIPSKKALKLFKANDKKKPKGWWYEDAKR